MAVAEISRRFRRDLYYRLAVIVLRVLPLRERTEDIPLLVEHFVNLLSSRGRPPVKFTPDALAELSRHPWPGNVPELKNTVERFMALSSGKEIAAADVSLHLSVTAAALEPEEPWPSLSEIERRYIVKVLRRTQGNRAQAARILGVDPKTLYNEGHAPHRLLISFLPSGKFAGRSGNNSSPKSAMNSRHGLQS